MKELITKIVIGKLNGKLEKSEEKFKGNNKKKKQKRNRKNDIYYKSIVNKVKLIFLSLYISNFRF